MEGLPIKLLCADDLVLVAELGLLLLGELRCRVGGFHGRDPGGIHVVSVEGKGGCGQFVLCVESLGWENVTVSGRLEAVLVSAVGDDWGKVLLGRCCGEVGIGPGAGLVCVPGFCCLTHEAAGAGVRCAWARFGVLSPIPTIRGASHHVKGCVSSVLACRTGAWAVGAGSLHGLERAEQAMVEWLCGVSLRDRG